MNVKIEFDARSVNKMFADAAKEADKAATKGVRKAAKEIALPPVKAAVAGRLPGVTTAGATRKGAYIRQKHPGAALDEFGGIRRDVIAPKSAQALSTPAGPRAVVKGERKYRGAHVLEPAVRRVRKPMAEATKKVTLEAFAAAGFKVSA